MVTLADIGEPVPNHERLSARLVGERCWNLLHWCHSRGMAKGPKACTKALKMGMVQEFRYLVHYGFPHDEKTTAAIARTGDLLLLQKVRL